MRNQRGWIPVRLRNPKCRRRRTFREVLSHINDGSDRTPDPASAGGAISSPFGPFASVHVSFEEASMTNVGNADRVVRFLIGIVLVAAVFVPQLAAYSTAGETGNTSLRRWV